MNQDTAAEAVNMMAAHLFAAEASIEEALGRTTGLMSTWPGLLSAADLSVFHGQDALEEASELIQILTSARRKAGSLHRKMDATQRQIGLRHVAIGPTEKPPETPPNFARLVAA